MTEQKTEYDRHAKQLWVKIYQDLIHTEGYITAKNNADIAVSDYMKSIHGISVVKENFTTEELTETYMNGWNDREAKAHTQLKDAILERDSCFDRLQELRVENADLAAENKRLKDQSVGGSNMIEVAFEIDDDGDVIFLSHNGVYKTDYFSLHCSYNKINKTRINRILLEMKSENE